MACDSLLNLPKIACGPIFYGGVSKLYAIRFDDLNEIFNTGKVYSVNESGDIDFISVKANKNFIEVGLLKNTTSLNEQLSRNVSTDSAYFLQKISLQLARLSKENRNWLESVLLQKVVIVVQTVDGFHAAGLFEGLSISSLERTTGTNPGDLIGASITFSGIDKRMFYNVEASVMTPSEYFNFLLEIESGNINELSTDINFAEP